MSDTEARIKEYRAKIEELETAKAFYLDKWTSSYKKIEELTLELTGCRDLIATLRNRVAEGESRVKELEGALKLCKIELFWLIDQVMARPGGSVWRAYDAAKAALLTEASDGK